MGAIDGYISELAAWLGRAPAVVTATIIMLAVLLVGSLIRLSTHWIAPGKVSADQLMSLASWWAIAASLTAVVVVGEVGLILLMAVVAALALHEYLHGMQRSVMPVSVTIAAYAVIALHYGCIAWGGTSLALAAGPALGALVLFTVLVLTGPPRGYIAAAGSVLLGVILCVYLPSFAVMLPAALPAETAAGIDPLAPPLMLLLVTMTHDIASALLGKTLGRRKVLPTISPRKTWEGTILGAAAAVALAALLAPALLGISWPAGAAAGLVIAVGAFFGDATVSAIKRDRGLRHSGRLLPGQGGVLDRIDSLCFAAPLLFLYLHLL